LGTHQHGAFLLWVMMFAIMLLQKMKEIMQIESSCYCHYPGCVNNHCKLHWFAYTRILRRETANWQAQSIGQDFVDLFLVTPCLLISAILAFRNNRNAKMIWGGVVLYITYTFVIYCFCLFISIIYLLFTVFVWDYHFIHLSIFFSHLILKERKGALKTKPFFILSAFISSLSRCCFISCGFQKLFRQYFKTPSQKYCGSWFVYLMLFM
jgi:hypothetical protein